ncbi:MAG: holo-[acyl-carrier-protein] synthase [Phycisphaerales bacterium]|nr:MAG: holo-[acyl-carrier-protein] synthase [Phycisphaerales bacterium]
MPLAHGVDLVEVSRIERMLAKTGDRFAERCFTESERAYCQSGGKLRAERYAARFAAKEAVMKALGTGWTGGVAWTDIEVTRDGTGRPAIALHNEAKALAERAGLREWVVSLSHTGTTAIASVIATG